MIIIIPACICTSRVSLAPNFRSRVRICYDSFYVHICLMTVFFCCCFLSLNICSSVRLNVSLIVGRCIFPSLDPCFFSLSVSFSLNTSISVRLYCHWLHVNRYVSWSSYLSFCLSVSVSGILSVILRVSWFVFLSLSVFLNVCSNVSLFYHSL